MSAVFFDPRPRYLSFRGEGRRGGDNRGKSNTFLAAGNKREWTSHACTTIVDNRRLIEMTEKELNFSHFSGKSFPFDSSINQFKNREIRSREEGITRETVEDGSRMFEAGWCSLF